MYVLDTNAFYYAAGISAFTYDLSKLQKLIESNRVFISSTSLFEFIIKYRNNIEIIKKGIRYLQKNNIKIVGNSINPISKHFEYDLEKLTEEQLYQLCEEILENKIDKESRFITLLFDMCLFSGYYFSAMSSGKEPSSFCNYITSLVCKMFGESNLNVFVDVFTEGYKTDDCENYVRNCFYNLLAFELEKGIPFIERAKAVIDEKENFDIDEWLPSEIYADDTETLNNRIKRKTSTVYLQRLAITYWKANNDPELKKHIQKIKNIFDKKIAYPSLQDNYYHK